MDAPQIEEEKKEIIEEQVEQADEFSEGSHGELSDSEVGENLPASLPDEFPWQACYNQNYIRQVGMSQSQKKATVKSLKPRRWLFEDERQSNRKSQRE